MKLGHTRLPEHIVASIATQIFTALSYLSEQAIVHNSIDEHNVMILNMDNNTINVGLSGFQSAEKLEKFLKIKLVSSNHRVVNKHFKQKQERDVFMTFLLLYRLLTGDWKHQFDQENRPWNFH